MITGEAGIGKSRLVEAVVGAVEAEGGHALVARAYPAEAGIAYGPVVELLRASLAQPDAGDRVSGLSPPDPRRARAGRRPPGPASRPRDVARARVDIAAIPRAASAWSRPSPTGSPPWSPAIDRAWSRWRTCSGRTRPPDALLAWLARRLAGRPILLVLTWRPEDLDDLGAAFAAVARRRARRPAPRASIAWTSTPWPSSSPRRRLGDSPRRRPTGCSRNRRGCRCSWWRRSSVATATPVTAAVGPCGP